MSKRDIAPIALISALLYGGVALERSPEEHQRLYGTKRNPGKPIPVVHFDIPEPKKKKKPFGTRKMTKRERKANQVCEG